MKTLTTPTSTASAARTTSRRAPGASARLQARARGLGALLRTDRVAQAVAALVVVHLTYRTWITAISWYSGDDFAFMSRMWNDGLSLRVAAEPYGGHLMPGGMYLTWLAGEIRPYDFTVAGAILVAMQLLADLGAVVLLVRMFGLRPGILPPLALYFFTVFSTPMAVWWAAAVNQLPFQIVFFWAMASHISYLRDPRLRHLVVTLAWLAAGLVFYEKTVLILGAIGIVSVAYFSSGSLLARVRTMWTRYRAASLVMIVAGAAYLVAYAALGLNFSATDSDNDLLGGVVTNMVVDAYAPGVVGGPLGWDFQGQGGLPHPGTLVTLASLAVIAFVLREIHRSRRRSLRAWWLPAFFLGCDIVLVLAGRASLVGDAIALEYRYQSELGAVTALALACATMPIIGAVESVETRRASKLLDDPRRVGAVVAVVSVLGLVSSTQFAWHWSTHAEGRDYYAKLLPVVSDPVFPVPMVDAGVPNFVMWGLGYPANLLSHVLEPYSDNIDYESSAVDHLMAVGEDGQVAPLVVPPTRRGKPGPEAGCGYPVSASPVKIPLDGPVAYGGWWVRVGLLASADTPVRVDAGGKSYDLVVPAGVHAIYVQGGDDFDSVRLSRENDAATVCTDDITVGRPQAVTQTQSQEGAP
ncbi:hypothetical protein ABLE68_21130 [Nocardioides sp. CN2-186]|uniref:hypothetical protein n=1 Tax=Nocardioides tweenelious TaxID=3156607 RepID=UPI0032B45390